jgi:hypothetical protein
MRALFLALVSCASAYHVSHPFPSVPYRAGLYHIHSPLRFMEAQGFALPGFRLLETRRPKLVGGYATAEFLYKTYFGQVSARVFSNSLNTSHVLLMDPDGIPCFLGKLSLQRLPGTGFILSATSDLLRPASIWERVFTWRRSRGDVLRAINLGCAGFRNDINLKCYVKMVFDCAKKRDLV